MTVGSERSVTSERQRLAHLTAFIGEIIESMENLENWASDNDLDCVSEEAANSYHVVEALFRAYFDDLSIENL